MGKVKAKAEQSKKDKLQKAKKLYIAVLIFLPPMYDQSGQVHLRHVIERYSAAIANNKVCHLAPLGNDKSFGRIEQ